MLYDLTFTQDVLKKELYANISLARFITLLGIDKVSQYIVTPDKYYSKDKVP